ncbi:plasmid pRiA4b ORF-3 family protein [Caldovatus aquaticus]|uniref:Plasmid pRiA4b ORF-3 family protein n=1 Tax=Caldovatus aquaticus TaxID=2865671 RepID=A0ABS7F263_9PROT|nr:plasmid pRiA4b ORF-3 family protein [Caldovatus aquaticus]MBW8269696.1 plasmid pRiA4b ORF-3 family protein [Caldovatus aquaticus]
MAGSGTHILRVALADDPGVFREIELPGGRSLHRLAEAVTRAFGRDCDRAFGFSSGRTQRTQRAGRPVFALCAEREGDDSDAGSVKKTTVAEAFPRIGHRMTFLFDCGDAWLFRVEMTGSGRRAPRTRCPRIVARAGEAPPQYPAWDEEESGRGDA